jgi:hypothetical protein
MVISVAAPPCLRHKDDNSATKFDGRPIDCRLQNFVSFHTSLNCAFPELHRTCQMCFCILDGESERKTVVHEIGVNSQRYCITLK